MSTHYFFMQAHSFALDDADLTEALYQGVIGAFQEDRRMIEAQQRLIASTPPAEMVGLPMDNALAVYRSIYQKILEAECAASTADEGGAS